MDWFRNNRPLVVSSACLVCCLLSAAHVFALYSSPAVFMLRLFQGGAKLDLEFLQWWWYCTLACHLRAFGGMLSKKVLNFRPSENTSSVFSNLYA